MPQYRLRAEKNECWSAKIAYVERHAAQFGRIANECPH